MNSFVCFLLPLTLLIDMTNADSHNIRNATANVIVSATNLHSNQTADGTATATIAHDVMSSTVSGHFTSSLLGNLTTVDVSARQAVHDVTNTSIAHDVVNITVAGNFTSTSSQRGNQTTVDMSSHEAAHHDVTNTSLHRGNESSSMPGFFNAVTDVILDDVMNVTSSHGNFCRLFTADRLLHRTLAQLLHFHGATLVEYRLKFVNYTVDPLARSSGDDLTPGSGVIYRSERWSRVTTAHGQTLLSLAFNYGVLSMMTLTFGTETLNVDLVDSPPGCFGDNEEDGGLTQRARIEAVRDLLMRDLDTDGPIVTIDEARVCHEIVANESGWARFRHNCCFVNSVSGHVECSVDIGNIWLSMLHSLLFVVRLALLFFGPVLFIDLVESMAVNHVPYVVKLKDPLDMVAMFCSSETKIAENVRYRRVLDLRPVKGLPKLKDTMARGNSGTGNEAITVGSPIRVRFKQYDISVDYKRTLTENYVDVGIMSSLFRAVFDCGVRNIGPFRHCCKADMMYGDGGAGRLFLPCHPPSDKPIQWIRCWRAFSSVLLILAAPFPYYIRLALFYAFENDELKHRKAAIAENGLRETYENSLIHYFLPTHAIFIVSYVFYVLLAIAMTTSMLPDSENRLKKILVGSFDDLKRLAWTDTLSMAVSNFIWPFRRFGLVGCLVGLVYWPIALPVTAIVCLVYLLPTIYLTFRMAFFSKSAIFEKARRRKKNRPYQVNIRRDKDMYRFQTDNLVVVGSENDNIYGSRSQSDVFDQKNVEAGAADIDDDYEPDDIDNIKPAEHLKRSIVDNISLASSIIKYQTANWLRVFKYAMSAILCIAGLYAIVVVQSEVVGCLVEIAVFTIMGVIVNAGALLKYVMLVLMIFVYCSDCFNNVEKKYLKLNKALFGEVKSRIRDLADVTSLPSSLQENRGFKSQELGEQADYESPDDIAMRPARHWMINDLVLFVDSEDTPRIPRQLFDEVCNIRVAGVPGPVYRGHIEAVTQLAKIILFILFVFLIVLSFGEVYRVSSTNQMLATMVGGFLPLVLRMFLAPPAPDVELGTVSFKSKMDEVIKNFCQYWPIYDLPFELVPPTTDTDDNDNDNAVEEKSLPIAASTPEERDNEAVKDGRRSSAQQLCLGTSFQQVNMQYFAAAAASGYDTLGGEFFIGSQDAYDGRQYLTTVPDSPTEVDVSAADFKSFARRQKSIRVVRVEEPSYENVDLIVNLPSRYDEPWLDEWSDVVSIRSKMSTNLG